MAHKRSLVGSGCQGIRQASDVQKRAQDEKIGVMTAAKRSYDAVCGVKHIKVKGEHMRPSQTAMSPSVSIVIPCRNEKNGIDQCLKSVMEQEWCGDFEIVVVDGMSDDGTREILDRISKEHTQIRIVDNPKLYMPSAVNIGIRASQGQYIAIMGAHNRYARDYLRQCVETLEQKQVDNVGGSMICIGDSYLQQVIALAHHSALACGGARWRNPYYEGPCDTVFGGVYRRDVFERIGLFDEELVRNQDDELNLRLRAAGGTIWHCPRAKSWYTPRKSVRKLFSQYLQYGYWRVRVIQKHGRVPSVRHVIPAAFVLSQLALPFLSLWFAIAGWMWVTVLGAYSFAVGSVSILTAGRHGWRFLWMFPAVLVCHHVAYGLGFLHGVLDFLLLRRAPRPAYSKLTRTSGTT